MCSRSHQRGEGEKMAENHKPTIDERIEALTQSLELAVHEGERQREEIARLDARMREEIARLDARERRARQALLTGIAAYLRALNEGDEGTQTPQ
jgi:hypothetical protein